MTAQGSLTPLTFANTILQRHSPSSHKPRLREKDGFYFAWTKGILVQLDVVLPHEELRHKVSADSSAS